MCFRFSFQTLPICFRFVSRFLLPLAKCFLVVPLINLLKKQRHWLYSFFLLWELMVLDCLLLSSSCLAIKPFAIIPIVCYLIKVKKLITRCDRDNDVVVDKTKAKTNQLWISKRERKKKRNKNREKITFTIIMNNDMEVCKC